MEPTTEIGGRRSKRLILKRNNEKLQKQQDSLDQIQHDVSFEKENKVSSTRNKRFKLKDHHQSIRMCTSIRTETVNAARRIIRRGIRKRRKSTAICTPAPIEKSINVDSNDCFTTDDKIPNNDIEIKAAILSDGKDALDETLFNTTNIQNISRTTKNSHHLDDPSHISVDANNDHQFTIKCEIDVEDNLAELSNEQQDTENHISSKVINPKKDYQADTSCNVISYASLNTSDLGNIIRADHDYIDLLVDAIKKEPSNDKEHADGLQVDSISPDSSLSIKQEQETEEDASTCLKTTRIEKDGLNIKSEPEEIYEEALQCESEPNDNSRSASTAFINNNKESVIHGLRRNDGTVEQRSNLSTLAEVSLATAGEFFEPNLNHQIDQARANLYPSNNGINNDGMSEQSKFAKNENLKIPPNFIPTIDLPQSVRDAILASANISNPNPLLNSPYNSLKNDIGRNPIPSMFPNHPRTSQILTTSSDKRSTSIELSHTPNRRMQITLPENTTHIVICTSGRGNNNDQINGNNSSTSVTLDINPKSSEAPIYKNIKQVQEIKTHGSPNSNSFNDISINNSNQIFTSPNSAATTTTNNLNDGRREKSVAPEGHLHETYSNDDSINESGKKSNYNCSECGKSYSTSSNLARHRQTHRSLDDTKAKKCPYCSKIYVSMPAFSMHMRTHNQNCKCNFCGKTFSRPWLLQGHLRTHTGERPYSCQICSKAFADKSNLRAHVQTHSSNKPYRCKHCGKTFALKSYLYKHEEAACLKNVTETH